MRTADLKVPVGLSTQVGVGLTVAGVATAIVAYATGDRSEQTTGTLAGAAVAILAFAITAAMRAVQAKALIVAHAPLVGTQTASTPLENVAVEIAKEVGQRLDEILSVQAWTTAPESPAPVADPPSAIVRETVFTEPGAPVSEAAAAEMGREPIEVPDHLEEGPQPAPLEADVPVDERRDLHDGGAAAPAPEVPA